MKDRHTILVIEDNEINREILNEILKDDYTLFFAENGEEGLKLLREHNSDINLVLLDIMMPVMDGYEVLENVGKDPILKEIPIVVTTGKRETEDEMKCLQMGAADFVVKPYNPYIVRLRVARIIRLRESMLSNMQKTMFIQNMRHEVRTPLNAIMGFSQMLCMPEGMLSSDEKEQYAEYIMNNSQMLMRMIDDMLALSDIDNGMLKLEFNDTAINDVCRKAMKTAQFSFPVGVNVYFTTDVDDLFTVKTDASRLQQAIVNYLTNACKFTHEGEIHLHCTDTEHEGYLTLSVADTGCGVPAEKADKIFERFVKLDSFTPGSGLGLSIISSIASYLGGRAYLDTTYSNGARFVFELPLNK